MKELSTLLMRLGLETRQFHAEVDEPWLQLVRRGAGRALYTSQLVHAYGIVAPFESACRYTPNLSRVVPMARTSAGLIAQDLLALGMSPGQVAALPQSHAITPFRGVAEALGWHYAIERASPLHELVHQHLVPRVPELLHASAYVSRLDGHVGDTWQMFGRILDRVGARAEVATEIVEAAKSGLSIMGSWYRGEHSDQRQQLG